MVDQNDTHSILAIAAGLSLAGLAGTIVEGLVVHRLPGWTPDGALPWIVAAAKAGTVYAASRVVTGGTREGLQVGALWSSLAPLLSSLDVHASGFQGLPQSISYRWARDARSE